MSRMINVSTALGEAIHEEMLRDQNVVIYGEDMVTGNVWDVLKGFDFMSDFGPQRLFDTPISESSFSGMAVGMAMRGMRPIVEWMYNDFIGVCLDPVMNQAAKLRYMTGGQISLPIVFRAPFGMGFSNAAQHSQSLEALFTHIPGLKVVCPSNAKDAKGLLKAAIRDNDPVVFLEHKGLYYQECEVPEEEYIIPLGRAELKREGSDVTILCYSRQVQFALEAAEELSKQGIEAEVLDLRSLVPLDWDSICASVSKTGRAITLEEGVRRGGIGAELSAQISEELFEKLKKPVKRLACENIVIPFSPALERHVFPHVEQIVNAVRDLVGK